MNYTRIYQQSLKNSSNLSNTIDYLNINLNNKTDELYKNLLAISKKFK